MRLRLTLVLSCLSLALGACGKKAEEPAAPAGYGERMTQEHRTETPTASPAAQVLPAVPTRSQAVEYGRGPAGPLNGYLAYPAAAEGGLPAVLVFHEWWGLNPNIKSMADQLAAQGYVALAVDLYGGRVADDAATARTLMEQALKDGDALAHNLRAAHGYLREQVKATRVGSIGWCLGGMLSLKAALLLPDQIDAAVIYYGHVDGDAEALKPLQAPVLGLFGGADTGIPVESVQAFEQALKSQGKSVEIHVYDGAGHAFANPSGQSYQAAPAQDAWQKSVTFLATHLKGG